MGNEFKGVDRRKHRRIEAHPIIDYKIVGGADKNELYSQAESKGLMLDISLDGAGFITHKQIPPKSTIFLDYTLINTKEMNPELRRRRIELKAKVCYSVDKPKGEYRIGICFLNISDLNRITISNFAKSVQEDIPWQG